MKPLAFCLTAALGIFVAIGAWAHDYKVGDLSIDHPFSRATPKGATTGAGYMTIKNTGAEPDRLIGANVDFAEVVEVHEMSMTNNVMRMRRMRDGLEVPAGGNVELKPGGYHIMFIRLKEPLVEGDRHKATLVFERAGSVEVEFAVESMAGGGMDHSKHEHHKDSDGHSGHMKDK